MTKKINEIKQMEQNLPDGIIRDSDTIFKDIMDDADFEVSGIAHEIFDIYQKTKDPDSFCELFEVLTGTSFTEYLTQCENVLLTES